MVIIAIPALECIWSFPEKGVPQIIHLNRILPYEPSHFGVPPTSGSPNVIVCIAIGINDGTAYEPTSRSNLPQVSDDAQMTKVTKAANFRREHDEHV